MPSWLTKVRRGLEMAAGPVALLVVFAWIQVPGGGVDGVRRFATFLGLRVLIDAVVLTLLVASGLWLARMAKGIPELIPWPRTRQWAGRLLPALLGLTVTVHAWYYARARAYYYLHLSRADYAQQALRVAEAAVHRGHTEEASRAALLATRVLAGTPEVDRVRFAALDLGAVVTRSQHLSEGVSLARARDWNPIADPWLYHDLAEAVRLNPQGRAAAESLVILVSALRDRALPADVASVCGAVPRTQHLTVPRLDAEWIALVTADRGVEACRDLLQRRWSLPRVECFLEVSALAVAGAAEPRVQQPCDS